VSALLEVCDLETFYGESQALFGVSLEVSEGELISLIGRNGMGKSTTVKTVMGLLAPRRGSVSFAGRTVHGEPAYRIAQAGLGLVPE
jgi:branched-chain amino acid transport system ATP-binding protein